MKDEIMKKVVVAGLAGLTNIAVGLAIKEIIRKVKPELLTLELDEQEEVLYTQSDLVKILRYTSVLVAITVIAATVAMVVEKQADGHFMSEVEI